MTPARPPRSRWRAAAANCLGVMLLVAACGGNGQASITTTTTTIDTEAATYKPDLDPCTLIPEDEAGRVLGSVADRRESDDPVYATTADQRVCVLLGERDPRVGVNIGYADFGAAAKLDHFYNVMGDQAELVDGVGDRAVWVESFRVLLVLDGTGLVSVQMTDVHEPDKSVLKQQALQLAAVALDRLSKGDAR